MNRNERGITEYHSVEKWKSVPNNKWNSWHWQLQNSVRSVEELRHALSIALDLTAKDANIITEISQTFEMKLTPHTVLNIIRSMKANNRYGTRALISAFVPTIDERSHLDDGYDSIGEELPNTKPARLVTNFYKTRVLLFAANMCPSYCRFCFRRRKVGDRVEDGVERGTDLEAIEEAIEYIKSNNSIREVIISGGDPLVLGDEKIRSLLQRLRGIKHIKVLRIDTKVLTTLPQRVTPNLVEILDEFKPLYVVGNFLHSVEITPETIHAASLLIDFGIPVFSHTPLLRNINDDSKIMFDLMWNLYTNRIIPYYLIQFIPTKWTEHFRVPIKKGLKIMEYLHSNLSGIATPTYIVYLPDGFGKIPISPQYLIRQTDEGYYFRSFEGTAVLYKEPIDI